MTSLARTPPWEPGGVLDGPGSREWEDPAKRGEYITSLVAELEKLNKAIEKSRTAE